MSKLLRQREKVEAFSLRYARPYDAADVQAIAAAYLAAAAQAPTRRAIGRDLDRLGRILAGVERWRFLFVREPDWWYRRRVRNALHRPILRGAKR